MSIWAYTGLPRNGKSYHVVMEQIIPALKQGRAVVTNIPMLVEGLIKQGCDVSRLRQVTNADLMKDKAAATIKSIEVGSLIVFDEVWRYLPKGERVKDVPAEWPTLFAEHGHEVSSDGLMTQIILVVQDLSNISAFARSLVERTVLVTKLEMIGKSDSYRVDTYAGNVTGLKPPKASRISEEFGKFKPEIFECYVSRTKSDAGSGVKVNEKGLSDRGTLLRNPAVRFGLPIAAVLIAGGLWRAWEWFHPDAPVVAASSSAPERSGVMERRVALVATGRLRVSAVIRAESDAYSRVLLDSCDGAPSRWVRWMAARCVDEAEGGVSCEWRGQRYEFRGAIEQCRADERRGAEIRWFPSDGGGPSESISVVGSGVD